MWQSLKNIYHFWLALLANLWFGYPSKRLILIGVTGTDGKTTTVHLIYEILRTAGKRVAMVSSVAARLGEKEIDTGFHVTTPVSFKLQRLLKRMVEEKYQYAVLEVTSHGLDQHRLLGCHFKVAVLTNITHEHLDYHKSSIRYVRAKAKLFRQTEVAILNADDAAYALVREMLPGNVKTLTYGRSRGDYTMTGQFRSSLSPKLSEAYNAVNALAAFSAAKALKIEQEAILRTLRQFKGIEGRMEQVGRNEDIAVFVDFAHTPNALKEALSALRVKRKLPSERIIAVFGAAGLRDPSKRPMMGEVASRLADEIVLTAEDPRTEDVGKIIEQIARGVSEETPVYKIPDRQKAIDYAIIELAKKNDVVAVFGKGHEKSMCFGRTEYPWSDHEAVRRALKTRKKAK